MARRFRRKSRTKRSRGRRYRRRGSRLGRIVACISRKVAGEVKKADNNVLLTQSLFTPLTPQNVGELVGESSLADYGALYRIFGDSSFAEGNGLDDFIGEQIRIKYLYIGLHLQQINTASLHSTVETTGLNGSAANTMFPITLRCMLIQDRNYNSPPSVGEAASGAVTDVASMVDNIFGIGVDTTYALAEDYLNNVDYTLLPINPHEPGRFNIIRDFRMSTAPGWRQDYYKKLMLLQKDLNSKGRIYFGDQQRSTNSFPPGEDQTVRTVARNDLYLLFLWQYPYLSGGETESLTRPVFNLSIQTRLGYYDN